MPIVDAGERRLATVETISEINPIEGADAIVAAKIRGWTVVVKINEFDVGDKVVYFEEDTALPLNDDRYAFLAPRGVRVTDEGEFHVLKIARLRGVYSQGLALPLGLFYDDIMESSGTSASDGFPPVDGFDVTIPLGLGKWEPPMISSGGNQKGIFTVQFAMKTDAERVQNLSKVWDIVKSYKWEATEKLDGTSLTVARDFEGNLRVNSRNWEMEEGNNTYWNTVKEYNLEDILNPGEAIQAEIVGPGVNGNRQNIKEVRPFIFAFIRDRKPLGRHDWPQKALELSVPVLDVKFPDSLEEALAQVDGMKSKVSPDRLAEGIVWHEVNGTEIPELGNRSVWKAVSNKYLTKSKD